MLPEAPDVVEDPISAAVDAVHIPERVIVSPCSGRVVPLPPEIFTTEGEWVEAGQAVAEIHLDGDRTKVISPFRGWLMGMLARPGQPVSQGQALFWVLGS